MNRREFVHAGMALGMLPALTTAETPRMITRAIPASGERLPVIGLGTWQVFDVPGSEQELRLRRQLLQMMVDSGASVIDTSPMYNRSEHIIGEVIAGTGLREDLFLATKVWTDGKAAGERQMQESFELMNADVIDLMQVHNRRDLDAHMGTIREWQTEGRIRYSGVTDYRESAQDEMETVIERYRPDFIQINYSLGEHGADDRLLPLARERAVAVLINRPYMSGRLFAATRGRELPEWSRDFAASWGQFFLKFIVSHPAVTCVIPATSKPEHMADNLAAGAGELPDAATRERMIRYLESL